MLKKIYKYLLFIVVSIFFISLLTGKIVADSRKTRLQEDILTSALYREQHIGEEVVSFLQTVSKPGKYVGLYLLESKFGYQDLKKPLMEDIFNKLEKEWKKEENYSEFIKTTEVIWNDVKYFPVPEFTADKSMTVSYANSWMSERTYGGERGHEGVDIMAGKNERGLYPVISMTDGVVSKKGWLDKGGYRIGILSPNGAYFYYAHLESYANLNVGDEVRAGDILGFMGDSGYGPEGTTGKFAVHLHLGIYIYPNGKEMSINPYWVLRYIENRKVKCYT
ncbi:MAG: M23 family metallopeptidase [Tyzzerella sp.]|nr:M23 family metallopeptidase [Tyzzerella sp.]